MQNYTSASHAIVDSRILGPSVPFTYRNHASEERVDLDARVSRIARWYRYEDAVTESAEEREDALSHLLNALQPSSACPELLERCLHAAAAE